MFGSSPTLWSALAELAEPIARLAGRRVDGSAHRVLESSGAAPISHAVAEVLSAAAITGMRADPPMRREGDGDVVRWVCVAPTRLVIETASGARTFDYPADTVIRVDHGLVQLPPEHGGSRLSAAVARE